MHAILDIHLRRGVKQTGIVKDHFLSGACTLSVLSFSLFFLGYWAPKETSEEILSGLRPSMSYSEVLFRNQPKKCLKFIIFRRNFSETKVFNSVVEVSFFSFS